MSDLIIVGLNAREAEAYYRGLDPQRTKGRRVKVMSTEHAVRALQGAATDAELIFTPRWALARPAHVEAVAEIRQHRHARGATA